MGKLKDFVWLFFLCTISNSGFHCLIFSTALIQHVLEASATPFHFSGIGVPIMLAYVYGVVPISLCRSGGCGVSAGNGKGVRIEFDDENDMNVGSGAAATGKLQCPHLHTPITPNTDTQKWPCMFLLSKASTQQNLSFMTDCLLPLFKWNLLLGSQISGVLSHYHTRISFLSFCKSRSPLLLGKIALPDQFCTFQCVLICCFEL